MAVASTSGSSLTCSLAPCSSGNTTGNQPASIFAFSKSSCCKVNTVVCPVCSVMKCSMAAAAVTTRLFCSGWCNVGWCTVAAGPEAAAGPATAADPGAAAAAKVIGPPFSPLMIGAAAAPAAKGVEPLSPPSPLIIGAAAPAKGFPLPSPSPSPPPPLPPPPAMGAAADAAGGANNAKPAPVPPATGATGAAAAAVAALPTRCAARLRA
eukprot:1020823-Pelagomonas_calceolata.AAC.4